MVQHRHIRFVTQIRCRLQRSVMGDEYSRIRFGERCFDLAISTSV
jgi:hypothetical protein